MAETRADPRVLVETVQTDRWEPSAPSEAAPSFWGDLLAQAVRSNGSRSRVSAELACAANEIARFVVEKGGFPEDSLRDFLIARCGSSLPMVELSSVQGAAPQGASDREVQASLESPVRKLLAQGLSNRGGEVGVGFARGNGRHAVVVCSGTPIARLDTTSRAVTGPSITLEGEAPRSTYYLAGFANQGQYGVAACEPDRALRPPRFRLSCPVAADDAFTFIEIATRTEQQVLFRPALRVLVHRGEPNEIVYQPPAYGGGSRTSAATSAAYRAELLKTLNEVRRSAGVTELGLEAKQSAMNEQLAPHFFEAAFEHDTERSDLVALGLLAGWDVAGMIRDGGIYSSLVSSTRSPERWVGHAMQSPLGRSVLLDADMSRAAVGAGILGSNGAYAVVTTYAFFGSQDHGADEARVFSELVKYRAALGLPAPRRVPSGSVLRQALHEVAASTATSDAALEDALQTISTAEHRSTAGWVVETSELSQLAFAGDLLHPKALDVAVGVTHYKAPGAAWGQYAVLFVIYTDGKDAVQTAASPVAAGRGL